MSARRSVTLVDVEELVAQLDKLHGHSLGRESSQAFQLITRIRLHNVQVCGAEERHGCVPKRFGGLINKQT